MELFIKITAFILSSFVFFFVSCKKENIPVHIPPVNKPPVAKAGRDTTIILPANSITLVGDNSYDPDYGDKIASYKWTKISGPNTFVIWNESAPVSVAKSLVKGTYLFELSVADSKGLTSKDTVLVRVDAATEPSLIFENLTWVFDTSEKLVYMQTPPIPGGYSLDSVLSVSISILDFDYGGFVWKAIGRGGSDVGYYHYKIDGNTVIVYKYYETYDQFINIFVERKIKVLFK
jgi:hypothetical protein